MAEFSNASASFFVSSLKTASSSSIDFEAVESCPTSFTAPVSLAPKRLGTPGRLGRSPLPPNSKVAEGVGTLMLVGVRYVSEAGADADAGDEEGLAMIREEYEVL